jgi:hypothetical protein
MAAQCNFQRLRERRSIIAVALLITLAVFSYVILSPSSIQVHLSNRYVRHEGLKCSAYAFNLRCKQVLKAEHVAGEDRLYFTREQDDKRISPWHDISFKPTSYSASPIPADYFVFICEIPRR